MKAFYAIARKPAAMEPQTNRPHTYEESTMSFRETKHFDINFRETRSISTTFSVPFLHHAILLFPLAHSFLLLSGSRSVIAGHKVARIVGKMSHHHHAFSFPLSQDSPPPLYTHFFPPPPPKDLPQASWNRWAPRVSPLPFLLPSFFLSLAVPSARKERQTPDRLYLFSTYRGKVEVDGGRGKEKKERKRSGERISTRSSMFVFLLSWKKGKKKTEFGTTSTNSKTIFLRNRFRTSRMGRDKYFSSRYGMDSFRLVWHRGERRRRF